VQISYTKHVTSVINHIKEPQFYYPKMSLVHFCMGFEAFTSVAKRSAFLWDIQYYYRQVETYRHFRKKLLALTSVYFYSEDGCKTFSETSDNMAPNPRRRRSSSQYRLDVKTPITCL